MEDTLKRFRNEIKEIDKDNECSDIISSINLELYKIKQKKEIANLNLKNHRLKLRINSVSDYKKVQELSFLLNSGWHHGSNKPVKRVDDSYDIAPSFFFIGKYLGVAYKEDEQYFENHKSKEITLEDLEKMTMGIDTNSHEN